VLGEVQSRAPRKFRTAKVSAARQAASCCCGSGPSEVATGSVRAGQRRKGAAPWIQIALLVSALHSGKSKAGKQGLLQCASDGILWRRACGEAGEPAGLLGRAASAWGSRGTRRRLEEQRGAPAARGAEGPDGCRVSREGQWRGNQVLSRRRGKQVSSRRGKQVSSRGRRWEWG
jgi:hypothetical protein